MMTLRIMSANLNGIRAAARKGFFEWFADQDTDILCIQETKAQIHQLTDDVFCPKGYHCYYHDATKKGYSGVAIFSKQKPDRVSTELGWPEADTEGRYIQADFGDLSVASLYLPSGSSGEERQTVKFRFMEQYLPLLQQLRNDSREYIICGDWNIVHKEIDIKHWKSNQKNSGCLPEERAWLDRVFNEAGYVDAFRVLNHAPNQYTWWSQRGRARDNDVGWRIDYQIVTPGLREAIKRVIICPEPRFSDHAPLVIDYEREIK